jgi:hypothetical protein
MARTWTPDFDFYPTLVEGRRASIVVDLLAAVHAPLAGYGTLVSVRIPMKSPRPDGLRDAAELEPLATLEDAVVPALEEQVGALSVGRLMLDGAIVLSLYAPDGTAEARVAEVLGGVDWDGYALRWTVAPDAEWRLLREVLAPDPYALQGIWNRRLLTQFAAQGDDHSAPREVDHVVVFESADAADIAARQLRDLGYRTDEPEPHDGEVRLGFHREDVLADGAPDTFVEQILDVVLPLGGDYDGWGAPVMQTAVGEA